MKDWPVGDSRRQSSGCHLWITCPNFRVSSKPGHESGEELEKQSAAF